MDLNIPDELATELKKKAHVLGIDPEDVAIQAIKRSLASEQRLAELLAPVRVFDLADVCSMHLAEREKIETVFTLDRKDFLLFPKKVRHGV